jgi:hypothetical protein
MLREMIIPNTWFHVRNKKLGRSRGDEMRVAMRQIAGVFSQLEKTRLVTKLAAARSRRRAAGHKVEGRKGFAEMAAHDPGLLEAIKLAKRLRRSSPKTGERMSLRDIAVSVPHVCARKLGPRGQRFNPQSVRAMVAGPQPRASRETGRNSR